MSATETAEDALAAWLRLFLVHARINQGLAGAFMLAEPDAPAVDCHQPIMDAAGGLLARAQQAGAARLGLSPDDLIQLIVGIALATARNDSADQADRLLLLALDAVHATPTDSGG